MLLHPWGLAHPSEGAVFRVLITWFVQVYPWQGPEDAESFSPGIRVGLVLLRESCCSIPARRWAFGGNHLAILQNLFVAPLRLVVVNISFIILTSGKKKPTWLFSHSSWYATCSGLPCNKKPKASSCFSCSKPHSVRVAKAYLALVRVIFGDPAACPGCGATPMDAVN